MFGNNDGHYGHFYMGFVPIIWIAMRQGIRRVVTGLLTINFGIVVAMHMFPPTEVMFTTVALLMLALSAVGLIVGSEVSERYRMAITLNQRTTYLDSLIENCPLGIVVLGRQGSIELANAAFEELFQHTRGEFATIDIKRLEILDSEVSDLKQLIAQIVAGNTLKRTIRQRRKDGKILDLALHGVPLQVRGEIEGAYLIYEDISEQIKAREAQRQQSEHLSLLVSELSLRTKQITLLNEMGSLLSASATTEETCAIGANSVQKLFPEAHSGAVYLLKSSRDFLEAAFRWGEKNVLGNP